MFLFLNSEKKLHPGRHIALQQLSYIIVLQDLFGLSPAEDFGTFTPNSKIFCNIENNTPKKNWTMMMHFLCAFPIFVPLLNEILQLIFLLMYLFILNSNTKHSSYFKFQKVIFKKPRNDVPLQCCITGTSFKR